MRIDKDTLFMRYPSTWWHDLWREGLPAGNGIIGANVYGGVKEETTMISHHDLWHGGKKDEVPDVTDAFQRQRELMDRGEFQSASWEVVNELKKKGYGSDLESTLPLVDFMMQVKPKEGFSDYVRGIHMDSGEIGCEWSDGDSKRSSYLFVSRTENAVIKEISSSKEDLDILFTMDMHRNEGSVSVETCAKHVINTKKIKVEWPFIIYTAQNEDGTLYGAVANIINQNGYAEKTPIGIRVKECSKVLVFIKVFIKENLQKEETILEQLKKELSQMRWDYQSLLQEHKEEHEKWYKSATLSLEYPEQFHCNEELLAMAYFGRQPVELIEKLWKYGRYLFVSGTAEQSNPFGMYGLWGGDYNLLWCHNMANENIQMMYWHSYIGNLLPLQKGFYEYYFDRIPEYQTNAQKIMGMKGIYIPAGSTPGVATPNQIVPVIINWVSVAGWLAQHYCLYYWYTRDEIYLKEKLLPYLEETAAFYEDFIEFYPNGKIHFYPSVSPENTPSNFMPPEHIFIPHPMPTTVNSTIDIAIIKEFFGNLIYLAKEKQIYQEKLEIWKKIIDSIPDYAINKDGAIREWQDERFEERYAHRHLSHIYPVFPGNEVNKIHHAELLPAFQKAVDLREIDAQTGWSLVHMASIYARLENGEAAMQCLNNIARAELINNFFTLHNDWRKMNLSLCSDPPIQLDAIMGYVNAIQEMILYVSNDFIKLLPALSEDLQKGKINSFRYINGNIDMKWDMENQEFLAVLTAVRDHEMYIQLPKEIGEYHFSKKDCSIWYEGEMLRVKMKESGCLEIKSQSK